MAVSMPTTLTIPKLVKGRGALIEWSAVNGADSYILQRKPARTVLILKDTEAQTLISTTRYKRVTQYTAIAYARYREKHSPIGTQAMT